MGDYDCKINEKVFVVYFVLLSTQIHTHNDHKRSDLKCEMYLLR